MVLSYDCTPQVLTHLGVLTVVVGEAIRKTAEVSLCVHDACTGA